MPANDIRNRVYNKDFMSQFAKYAQTEGFSKKLTEKYSVELPEEENFDPKKITNSKELFEHTYREDLKNAVKYKEYMKKIDAYCKKDSLTPEESRDFYNCTINVVKIINADSGSKSLTEALVKGDCKLIDDRDVKQLLAVKNEYQNIKMKIAVQQREVTIENHREQLGRTVETVAAYEAEMKEYKEKFSGYKLNEPNYELEEKQKELKEKKKELDAKNKQADRYFREETENNLLISNLEDDLKKDRKTLNDLIVEGKRLAGNINVLKEAKKLSDTYTKKSENLDKVIIELSNQEQIRNTMEVRITELEREKAEKLALPQVQKWYDARVKLNIAQHLVKKYEQFATSKQELEAEKNANTAESKKELEENIAKFIKDNDLKAKTIPDSKLLKTLNSDLEKANKIYKNLKADEDVIGEIEAIDEMFTTINHTIADSENYIQNHNKEKIRLSKEVSTAKDKLDVHCKKHGIDSANIDTAIEEADKKLTETEGKCKKLSQEIDEKEKKYNFAVDAADTLDKNKDDALEKAQEYEEEIRDLEESTREEAERAAKDKEKKTKEVKEAATKLWSKRNAAGRMVSVLVRYSNEDVTAQKLIDSRAEEFAEGSWGAEGHKNSTDYEAMMNAVNSYLDAKNKEEKTAALVQMKEKAKEYIDAKNSQWRPFPSTMRTWRLSYAQNLMEFAAKGEETLLSIKTEEVNKLIEDSKAIIDKGYIPVPEEKDFKAELEGIAGIGKPVKEEKETVEKVKPAATTVKSSAKNKQGPSAESRQMLFGKGKSKIDKDFVTLKATAGVKVIEEESPEAEADEIIK